MEEPKPRPRSSPGLPDWLLALACSILIALEIQTQGARQTLQSAVTYYFDSPWVPQMHTAALVLDGSVFVLALLWFITPLKRLAEGAMIGVAMLGLILCWVEVVYALRLQEGAIYVLHDLPFRPTNNLGVIGAQVFGSYLILKLPFGRPGGLKEWLVKIGLAVAFWFFQAVVWGLVVPG